jgi:hypothetical protein
MKAAGTPPTADEAAHTRAMYAYVAAYRQAQGRPLPTLETVIAASYRKPLFCLESRDAKVSHVFACGRAYLYLREDRRQAHAESHLQ